MTEHTNCIATFEIDGSDAITVIDTKIEACGAYRFAVVQNFMELDTFRRAGDAMAYTLDRGAVEVKSAFA
jgi:hypothetical protein